MPLSPAASRWSRNAAAGRCRWWNCGRRIRCVCLRQRRRHRVRPAGVDGRRDVVRRDRHGYEVPQDGFGYRGVRLTPEPGGTLDRQGHAAVCRPSGWAASPAGASSPRARSSGSSRMARTGHPRLRQRAERRASRQAVLGVGRHDAGGLSAGAVPHERRDDRPAAARVVRAAGAAALRLLPDEQGRPRTVGQDARRGTDLAERLREPARQRRQAASGGRAT